MTASSLPTGTSPEHHHYRVGFFWPILLIGLGIIFLLNNINALPGDPWSWVLRLWPVLLIAWGLDNLLRLDFVGATLLTGLGVVFLLSNFNLISLNPWQSILTLWPLFIVAAGVSLIFNRRWVGVAGSIIGAVVILGILAAALWFTGMNMTFGQASVAVTGQRVTQEVSGATKAHVILEPIAGSLTLKALPEPTALVAGDINIQGDESINRTFSVDNGTATLRLKGEGTRINTGPWTSNWHGWNLGVNPELPTNLEVNMAAGDINLDLTDLNLSSLDVRLAVGSISITLPRTGQFNGRVNGAMGSTTIVVPAGVGLRLVQSGALVVVDAPSSFIRNGKEYTNLSYSNAVTKVDLVVSQAIGTIKLRDESGR